MHVSIFLTLNYATFINTTIQTYVVRTFKFVA